MRPTPLAAYELSPTWLDYLAAQDPEVGRGYHGRPNLSVIARKAGFPQVYVWRVAHGVAAPNLQFMGSLVAMCSASEEEARRALFPLRHSIKEAAAV